MAHQQILGYSVPFIHSAHYGTAGNFRKIEFIFNKCEF